MTAAEPEVPTPAAPAIAAGYSVSVVLPTGEAESKRSSLLPTSRAAVQQSADVTGNAATSEKPAVAEPPTLVSTAKDAGDELGLTEEENVGSLALTQPLPTAEEIEEEKSTQEDQKQEAGQTPEVDRDLVNQHFMDNEDSADVTEGSGDFDDLEDENVDAASVDSSTSELESTAAVMSASVGHLSDGNENPAAEANAQPNTAVSVAEADSLTDSTDQEAHSGALLIPEEPHTASLTKDVTPDETAPEFHMESDLLVTDAVFPLSESREVESGSVSDTVFPLPESLELESGSGMGPTLGNLSGV